MLTRSALIIIFLVYQSWSWGQAGIIKVHSKPEDATKSVVTGIRIEKHGCGLWDVYVQGYVTNKNGYARVPGALIRGTLLNSRDIDFVYYFDHYSYIYPGFSYYIHYPNYTNESRAISDAFGFYQLRFHVCTDDWGDWSANFTLCSEKQGFKNSCIYASFNENDDFDERSFILEAEAVATPTPTPLPTTTVTPTATVTATPTLAPTATPTRTPTHSGIPPASHPQLDVDQDGEIGPGDLLLLLNDWKKPSK
ncbi:MAG: hypothetical protein IPI28_11045 [Candidatus Omnitrophica bacterium]|nr:hypothetical protein [Candidatus Omnitrophota bacterium]